MASPRVSFVDHAGVLGGAELYLLDVARSFGDAASVVLFEDGPFRKRLEHAGLTVHVLPASEQFLSVQKEASVCSALAAVPGFVSIVKRVRHIACEHDVVVANSQKALIAAGPASWWANRPLIWNLHDLLTAEHFSPLTRRLSVLFANAFADRVIVNSRATRRAFGQSSGDESRCRVVYNGFDHDRFATPTAERLDELQRELDVPASAPTVGVFGRLAPWKGQHVLIDALTNLPDVHALVVGSPMFEGDDSYANDLRQRAKQKGVNRRVHFLGFRDDVPLLLHYVDVVAHTSVAPEPFGRVIVEGMLSGKPVIAARAGGPTEIIDEPSTGLLVPPGEPAALAAAIQNLISHPERVQSIGAAARASARERFSINEMQRKVHQIVENVASDI